MTGDEFISQVPAKIEHQQFGYGELQLSETDGIKGAWYRHEGSKVSGSGFGKSWDEVYDKLSKFLKEEGLMK